MAGEEKPTMSLIAPDWSNLTKNKCGIESIEDFDKLRKAITKSGEK